MSPSIWNNLIHHPDPDVRRCALLWLPEDAPQDFGQRLEQARLLLSEGHFDAACALLKDMEIHKFPQDATIKACLELAQSPSPEVRLLAIETLNRYFWAASASLTPKEARAILDCFHTLVDDKSPWIRERVKWRLIVKGELSLDALTETPWPSGSLTRYCLDKGIFAPMVPEFLLKIALAPDEPLGDQARDEALGEWLDLDRYEPYWFPEFELRGAVGLFEIRCSGIHELIRLFFLAEPETCQALGMRLFNEALLPIREVGAVLLGIAGKTSEGDFKTSSPEDPDSKRLALLAHLTSQSGTQTLRQMLASKEERDLEVAARALLWRSAWDPAALALILRVPEINHAWINVDPLYMAVAPAWLWKVDFVKRFKAIGEDLPNWYLPDADIPIAPETVPPRCTVITRATMALCQSTDPAAREIGRNLFYNSGDFRKRPILDDFFKTMMKDPDPLCRIVGTTCFIQKGVSWKYFLDNPLDEDADIQRCIACDTAEFCDTPERTLILERILREGHPYAAIRALHALTPMLSDKDFESHIPLIRQGMKRPECREDAISVLLKRPLQNLRTELEELGNALFDEIPKDNSFQFAYVQKALLKRYMTLLLTLGGFDEHLDRWIDQARSDAMNDLESSRAERSRWTLELNRLLLTALEVVPSAHGLTRLLAIPQTALHAAKGLGRLGTPQALDKLMALSRSIEPFWRRIGAAGLALHPSPEAFSALQAMLKDESMTVKRRACVSLAYRQEKEALDLLESLIQAPSPEMRRAAAFACMSVEIPNSYSFPSIANTFAGFCRSCRFTENASTLRSWRYGNQLARQLLNYVTCSNRP